MIIDDQNFIMKISDYVISVPRVLVIDAFEFIWILSIVSSAFCFNGVFLGTPLLLGTTGAVVAAFSSFLPKPYPNPLWVNYKLVLIVIHGMRN